MLGNMFKNNEFDARLEDHRIPDTKYYRLYYIDYMRSINGKLHCTDWPCPCFVGPCGLDKNEIFKILSYLTDYIESCGDVKECSLGSVITLNSILDIPRLGFSRVNEVIPNEDIINLFTVAGRIYYFKKSKNYEKYFDWYTPNVSKEEIVNIYKKIGINFYDLVKVNEKESSGKKLELKY